MAADCDVSPTFCNANKVYMKYCDGDSFSGARDEPMVVEGGAVSPIYFRGHAILMETLETLVSNTTFGMGTATELVLSGCSAGGLATYLHVDLVGEWAEAKLPKLEKYGAIPVSGFFLEHATVTGPEHAVYPNQMAKVFEMANASRGVDQGCIAHYKAADPSLLWRCNFAHGSYAFTDRPVFSLDSSFDSWQSSNVFISPYYDADTAGFNDCADSLQCDATQAFAVNAYQGDFVTQLTAWSNTLASGASGKNGAFIYQCFTHCAGSDDGCFKGFTIDGVTMAGAVDQWWGETLAPGSSDAKGRVYIDGLLAPPRFDAQADATHGGEPWGSADRTLDEKTRLAGAGRSGIKATSGGMRYTNPSC